MVGEIAVLYSSDFVDNLDNLVHTLYRENYFGFINDAQDYVMRIYDFIDSQIHLPISKRTPSEYHKFGSDFIKYTANKNTSWYIFFDKHQNTFFVNHLINNHSNEFSKFSKFLND